MVKAVFPNLLMESFHEYQERITLAQKMEQARKLAS
jgi:hypothetical protein